MLSPNTRAAIYTVLTILGVTLFLVIEALFTEVILTFIIIILAIIGIVFFMIFLHFKDWIEKKDEKRKRRPPIGPPT